MVFIQVGYHLEASIERDNLALQVFLNDTTPPDKYQKQA